MKGKVIRVCRNPGCYNEFVPQDKDHLYCSPWCRIDHGTMDMDGMMGDGCGGECIGLPKEFEDLDFGGRFF